MDSSNTSIRDDESSRTVTERYDGLATKPSDLNVTGDLSEQTVLLTKETPKMFDQPGDALLTHIR